MRGARSLRAPPARLSQSADDPSALHAEGPNGGVVCFVRFRDGVRRVNDDLDGVLPVPVGRSPVALKVTASPSVTCRAGTLTDVVVRSGFNGGSVVSSSIATAGVIRPSVPVPGGCENVVESRNEKATRPSGQMAIVWKSILGLVSAPMLDPAGLSPRPTRYRRMSFALSPVMSNL